MNHTLEERVHEEELSFLELLRWLALAGLTGLVCGLAGAAFSHVLTAVTTLRENQPWLLFFMPLAGLVIVWMYQVCGMENDSGTNQILASVRGGQRPPLRLAPLIFIGAALTHLTGGSAGREGAALQIGGSLAAALGKWFRVDERRTNAIILCGMSGLFSALFGTPLAATVFCLEVVSVGIFHYSVLFPALLSALVSVETARLLGVTAENYILLGAPAMEPLALLKVGGLAVLCALLSILFCAVMHQAAHLYRKYLPNQYLRVLAGAVIVILLTLLEGSGDYNGAGGAIIERALEGEAVPYAFLFKLLLTALTLGAGFRGGEIVPTLFVGSTFGCAVAPLLGLDPAFGAAIGMIALFCGVVNCPMGSIFLSIELFGGEGLLFFALACAVSYLISGKSSLYGTQKLVFSKLEPRRIDELAE